jgi:hypothetical protein
LPIENIANPKKTPNGQHLKKKIDNGMQKLSKFGRYDEIIGEFMGTKS